MISNKLSQKISDLYEHIEDLKTNGMADPRKAAGILSSALKELEASLEDLTSAEEEISQQNEELLASSEENARLLTSVQEERDRLAALVNSINDEVWFADTQKKFTLANRSALREFRLSANEIDIEKLAASLEVYRPDGSRRPVEESPPLLALQGKAVRDQEEMIKTPATGEIRYRQVSSSPVKDVLGNIIGSVSVVHDITEAKMAEEALACSNRKISEILESIQDGFFALDRSWCFAYINERAAGNLGMKPEEILGQNIWERFPGIRGTAHEAAYRKAMNDRETQNFEINGVLTDRSYNIIAYPSAEGISVYWQDVTERKMAEEALRTSDARLNTAMETVREGVIIATEAEDVVYWNPAAQALHGFTKPGEGIEPLSDTPKTFDLIYPDTGRVLPLEDWPMKRIKRGEKVSNLELLLRRPDQGWVKYVSYSGTMVETSSCESLIFLTVYDLTERKQAEEELARSRDELELRVQERTADLSKAKEELEVINEELSVELEEHQKLEAELTRAKDLALEAVQAKAAFLANMSHELRTPMNAIIGFTGLLLDETLSREQRDYLERVRNSGNVLLALINDILEFSKIERQKVNLEKHPFSLRHLIEESLDLVSVQAGDKGLDLTYTIRYGTPDIILGDQGRVRQVLVNLLSNAVKFTDNGSVSVSLSSKSLEQNKYEIKFEVEDTGIGISPENLDKLFKPFSQVDTTISGRYGGTGLGLAISKNLVQLMGGKIWAQSSPSKGSKFSFTLEAKTAQCAPLDLGKTAEATTADKPAQKHPLAILIAEDNPSNQKVLQLMLERMGYRADAVADGMEAVQSLKNRPYDLIFMDLKMPEMDGLEATRQIRSLYPEEEQPWIIAITAYAMAGDRERCIEAGMDDYIAKPVGKADLEAILRSIAPQ